MQCFKAVSKVGGPEIAMSHRGGQKVDRPWPSRPYIFCHRYHLVTKQIHWTPNISTSVFQLEATTVPAITIHMALLVWNVFDCTKLGQQLSRININWTIPPVKSANMMHSVQTQCTTDGHNGHVFLQSWLSQNRHLPLNKIILDSACHHRRFTFLALSMRKSVNKIFKNMQ